MSHSLLILKGDKVRIESGETGEVIDLWGIARKFVSIKQDSDGRTVPMVESKIIEVIYRAPEKRRSNRGKRREDQ